MGSIVICVLMSGDRLNVAAGALGRGEGVVWIGMFDLLLVFVMS